MYEYESIFNHKKYYSSVQYSDMEKPYDDLLLPLFYSFNQLKTITSQEYTLAITRFANEIAKFERSDTHFSSLELILNYYDNHKV